MQKNDGIIYMKTIQNGWLALLNIVKKQQKEELRVLNVDS